MTREEAENLINNQTYDMSLHFTKLVTLDID